ncbi:hypothetical protein [Oxalobacter aliiformigenes]|uniref:hypothetical protein n=1 Tax=Oxalobacter aliiformigenes TaxID=2946593 RepID=UPI0022B0530B|nr:hypothetical protein [Oxalobacter aliiformigenes]WAV93259.1 hypothetical protein NB641_00375 [Oxalobacter aliiformigenes]
MQKAGFVRHAFQKTRFISSFPKNREYRLVKSRIQPEQTIQPVFHFQQKRFSTFLSFMENSTRTILMETLLTDYPSSSESMSSDMAEPYRFSHRYHTGTDSWHPYLPQVNLPGPDTFPFYIQRITAPLDPSYFQGDTT